ncbi:MAG: hypothetical protein ACK5H2_02750 [Beutenbergiaceae bacterium]
MTIFDPYDTSQQAQPGLNAGSVPDVSTLGQYGPQAQPGQIQGPDRPGRVSGYRSGAVSALATFLGLSALLLPLAMLGLIALWDGMCSQGTLPAATCFDARIDETLPIPAAVLILGLVLAAISGRLGKRGRPVAGLVTALFGLILLGGALARFAEQIGLPIL